MAGNRQGHKAPYEIAQAMVERIRQLCLCREMLALEALPPDLHGGRQLAVQHLDFVIADLQHDLDGFKLKYGLGSGPMHKGMR